MSQDLPVQDAPLFMDETLNNMLSRYMEDKPYKLVKQVVEAIKPVERKLKNAAGEEETRTVYSLPRATAVYLLNQVMGTEEMVKTYMFIRQGYEQAIANDQAAAAAAAAAKAKQQKTDRVQEVPAEDNIPAPVTPAASEVPAEAKADSPLESVD